MNASAVNRNRILFTLLVLAVFIITITGNSWSKVYAQDMPTDTPASEPTVTGTLIVFLPIVIRAIPNQNPTDILLSNSTIAENQPINTVVGMLSTVDPNVGDTFTYSLVSGAGDTDNGSFNILGDQLRSSAVFDYETKNSYSIRILTTDQGGLYFEKALIITITFLIQSPTDIFLSNSVIQENQPINTVVGTLSTTDPNFIDTFTYSLVSGTGDADNGSFNISGDQLRSSAVFNYESKNSYSIRIRTTDYWGLFFEKVFTITITFVNQSPTDILLSNSTIAENQPINTVVGTLSTTDPNVGDTFTYSLVSGEGDTGNASFNIYGNQLLSSVVFEFEYQNSYSIRIRTTDQGGLFFEKVFIITIAFLSQNPTDILLSNSTIAEYQPINTVVGNLSSTDPNFIDTFTYSLVSGAGDTGNASFNISGDQLRSSAFFDYETQNSYSIRIRTTDQGNQYFEKAFIITIVADNSTGVVILPNQSYYINSIDYLHVVGEVQNNTGDNLRFVKITANFFDASGQLLDTDYTYANLDNLPAWDKTCFNVSVPVPSGWSYYQFEAPTYWTDGQPLPNLTVLNDSGSYDPTFGWYEVIGQVRNDNGGRVEYVSPVGTIYNASGSVMGCDFTYVSSTHLDPGQISSFEMTFIGRDYADVASYRLQVDGDPVP